MSAARQEFTAGLRAIADMLDANDDLPLPSPATFNVFFFTDTPAEDVAAVRRAIGGQWDKGATDSFFWLRRMFGPHALDLTTMRDEVCERVVVGTRQVEVADPAAPKVMVEEEVVEWVCSPLLTSDAVSA